MQQKIREAELIKIESEKTDFMFYEANDLVIGKCQNSIPWPGIITHFKGYDEDEVQVFTVEFIGVNSYAHLQTYLLMPLSFKNINKIQTKYRHNAGFIKALNQAQSKLLQLKKHIQGDYIKQMRFKKMYQNQNESRILVDVDCINKGKNFKKMSKGLIKEYKSNLLQYFYDQKDKKANSRQQMRKIHIVNNVIDLKIEVSSIKMLQNKYPILKQEKIKTVISESKTNVLSISNRPLIQKSVLSLLSQITYEFRPFELKKPADR